MGGRLPLLDPAAADAAQRRALDVLEGNFLPWAEKAGFRTRDGDGRLIGPFNSALYSPELSAAFLDYQASEQQHTTLDPRVREVVILTVGAVWKSAYELYAHSAVAAKAGLSDAVIAALADGDTPKALTGEQATAHRLARALVVERQVGATLFAEGEAAFALRGLVDLVHLVGAYQTVCGLLNAFAIPAPTA